MTQSMNIRFKSPACALLLIALSFPFESAHAQPPSAAREQFIPADQLETVFERDRKGVMIPREQLQELLKLADANAAANGDFSVPIIAEQASITVIQADQHALVQMTLKIRQFADGWQLLRIPVGNLLTERAEIDDAAAVVSRDPQNPQTLIIASRTSGSFTLQMTFSTPLVAIGSDRSAAFQLPKIPTTQLLALCPAGQQLLVNDLKLQRPVADEMEARYVIPLGAADQVRLRWTAQQQKTESPTLVFVRTDAQLKVQKEAVRWISDSTVSVFGGTINRMILRVPARMEITSVESTGLESWTLDDDSERPDTTRVTLAYRQPFTNDRLVRIQGVAVTKADAPQTIASPEFADVTSHVGRLAVTQEDGLRLLAETGGGIRAVVDPAQSSSTVSVFDFWMQDFDLKVAVKPRDRELFSELVSQLTVSDVTSTFSSRLTIETLSAPLFDLTLSLPADWQLTSVTSGGTALDWRAAGESDQILIVPPAPIPAGGLFEVTVTLVRTIADPETEQKIPLPFVIPTATTLVGGTYRIDFAEDLNVAPTVLNGLRPTGGTSTSLSFENLSTSLSGEVSVTRKIPRLAARSILRTHADSRQQTLEAELTVDVVQGTTRTLTIGIPEALGSDVHFNVISLGAVPGFESQRVAQSVTIAEQTPLDPVDGMRPFRLTFDKRFAGSVTIFAVIRRTRTESDIIGAPRLTVTNAVRQHGVLIFEASPEQQLQAVEDVTKIDGLFVADAGLTDPPPAGTGRRVALTYRFVRPDYQLSILETRFATEAVPSAVMELVHNVIALNEAGGVRRSCTARFRSSGVQTLKFALPGPRNAAAAPAAIEDSVAADDAFLWSAMLNGEPVEVRRDGVDYLVALPLHSDGQTQTLELLLESKADAIGTFGQVEQRPLNFSIDIAEGQSAPVNVLLQTWDVRYPQSSLLVDSDGQFRPVDGVDQPGWFISAFESEIPSGRQMINRGVPLVLFLLALFVLSVLALRRSWKTLGAVVLIGGVLVLLALPATQQARESASRGYFSEAKTSRYAASADVQTPQANAPMERFDADSLSDAMGFGGMGGKPASGGMGGGEPSGLGGVISRAETLNLGEIVQPPAPAAATAADPFGLQTTPADSAVAGANAVDELNVRAGANAAMQGMPRNQNVNAAVAAQAAVNDPIAQPKKGSARLSVRVDLEVPTDYRSRDFRSVGDSVATPATLQLVVQRQSQISAFRVIAALIVMLLCWRMRSASAMTRLLLAITILLVAAGFVPLVSNQWQSALDGVIIGTVLGGGIWVSAFLINNCLTPFGQLCARLSGSSAARSGAVIAFLALTIPASAQESPGPTQVERPNIIVPYSSDEPALRASRVFIPHDQFLKLYRQAYPNALPGSAGESVGSVVVAAFYKAETLTQVQGTTHALSVTARYVLISDSDNPVSVPLPIGPVGIRSAQLDGQDAIIQPIPQEIRAVNDSASQETPQQAALPQAPPGPPQQAGAFAASPENKGAAYTVLVKTKGAHVVDLEFDVSATIEAALGRIELPLRPVPAGTLELTLPTDDASAAPPDVRVNGRSNVYRRDGDVIILPIAESSDTRIQWQPSTRRRSDDVLFHSSVTSVVSLTDVGLRLRSAVDVECRQGDISELDVRIPDDYAVQAVAGEDVAGWSIQNTDATRSLRLLFRRAVNDKTTIRLELYSGASIEGQSPAASKGGAEKASATTSLSMPILSVPGSTRDSGTLLFLAGPQFQVRSDALSGVSQINPQDAPIPDGDELPGNRLLAWRYTRHPASVSVRASRTNEEMVVAALHAVRLEEQRQLWTSQISVRISGGPRSRIDLTVPQSFLAMDVNATGLSDWYFDDGPAANQDTPTATPAPAATKTLTIQLDTTREGTIAIVLRGQMDRDSDRSQLTLRVPEVRDATSATSQMAVWLDAASDNAGVDSGNWVIRPPTAINPQFQTLIPEPPNVALTNGSVQPSVVLLRLRRALPTLITESVTISNATDTSLEITLALNWQVTRAAADTFLVEIPSVLVTALHFDVPNQRRLLREDLGNGRTRVTIQLQQTVSDQLFVLATGSLPLPSDSVIRAQSPAFVVTNSDDATIASQSHFWVLVNQSAGLLQSDGDQQKNEVSADQIGIRIRPELLEQSVTVQRLRGDTPSWTLKFPEQHQVAPAVVSLASHTTVLADDGSWRSRHELQMQNESRQFLPVRIPPGSRLLYCLVQGRPTRVVIQKSAVVPAAPPMADPPAAAGADEGLRLLIPIPQSGAIAGGFDVSFALAGHLGVQGATLRDSWKSRRVVIPVPKFPEFRDDPEFGITVSRNRWSVFVPEAWRATLVDDPAWTNVVAADVEQLEDETTISQIGMATQLLNSLSTAKGEVSKLNLWSALKQQEQRLSAASGNSPSTESERSRVLSQLKAAESSQALGIQLAPSDGGWADDEAEFGSNRAITGNFNGSLYLFEQEMKQNDFSLGNSRQLIMDNRALAETESLSKAGTDSGSQFYFALPEQSPAQRDVAPQTGKLSEKPTGRDEGQSEGATKRSQLLSRRSGELQDASKELEKLSQTERDRFRALPMQVDDKASSVNDAQLPQEQSPLGRMQSGQQPIVRAAERDEAAGLLSLQFEIPTDGVRLDFIRVGGNPSLSVNIRSEHVVTEWIGLAWVGGCLIVALILIRTGLHSPGLTFLRTLFLWIAVVSGLGGILLSGAFSGLCLALCVTSSVAFSGLTIRMRFAKTARTNN